MTVNQQQDLTTFLYTLLILLGPIAVHASSPSESSNHVQSEQELWAPKRSLRGLNMAPNIINGNTVQNSDRFPYYAVMSDGSTLCGASLISNRFVLTAAHCVGDSNYFQFGMTEMSTEPVTEKYFYKKKIVHPNYDDDTIENDIALYELDRDVPDQVLPIRLESKPVTRSGTPLTVIGFGDTIADDWTFESSETLQKTTIGYMPNEDCQEQFGRQADITSDMMCAYADGTDSCQGDSGGPLIEQRGSNPADDSLVGIVSWGLGCAGDTPGIYARVSYFYDWIADNMCGMNPDAVPDYIDCAGSDTGSGDYYVDDNAGAEGTDDDYNAIDDDWWIVDWWTDITEGRNSPGTVPPSSSGTTEGTDGGSGGGDGTVPPSIGDTTEGTGGGDEETNPPSSSDTTEGTGGGDTTTDPPSSSDTTEGTDGVGDDDGTWPPTSIDSTEETSDWWTWPPTSIDSTEESSDRWTWPPTSIDSTEESEWFDDLTETPVPTNTTSEGVNELSQSEIQVVLHNIVNWLQNFFSSTKGEP